MKHIQIAHPSRRGRDGDSFGADGKVKDFRWQDPTDGRCSQLV